MDKSYISILDHGRGSWRNAAIRELLGVELYAGTEVGYTLVYAPDTSQTEYISNPSGLM
jgi:hypothetical protein